VHQQLPLIEALWCLWSTGAFMGTVPVFPLTIFAAINSHLAEGALWELDTFWWELFTTSASRD